MFSEAKPQSPQPHIHEQDVLPFLPVRFSDVLLPQAQEFYDKVAPKHLQDAYESKLHGVWRMAGVRAEGIPVDEHAESDLQHMVEVMRMAADYGRRYPIESIDPVIVQILGGMHDAGEAAKGIGDVRVRGRTHRDEARKRLEPIAAREAIFSQIPDPHYREIVSQMYTNYVNEIDDPNIQMARLLDKVQGSRELARLTQSLIADREIGEKMYVHFLETLPRMVPPALTLMEILPTQKERATVRAIVNNEFTAIEDFGHRRAVAVAREQFKARAA